MMTGWEWATEYMLVLLPISVAMTLLLNRKAIGQPPRAFFGSIFFAAACLGAMAIGLALGLAGWTRYGDAGCWTPPVVWHGCRVSDVLGFGLVWSAAVVGAFLTSALIWRWLRARNGRMLNRGGA